MAPAGDLAGLASPSARERDRLATGGGEWRAVESRRGTREPARPAVGLRWREGGRAGDRRGGGWLRAAPLPRGSGERERSGGGGAAALLRGRGRIEGGESLLTDAGELERSGGGGGALLPAPPPARSGAWPPLVGPLPPPPPRRRREAERCRRCSPERREAPGCSPPSASGLPGLWRAARCSTIVLLSFARSSTRSKPSSANAWKSNVSLSGKSSKLKFSCQSCSSSWSQSSPVLGCSAMDRLHAGR